jgi:hypothetical protein
MGDDSMRTAKVIRYRTKPESADENEHLIREVFTELAAEHPRGIRYAAFRLEDRVSFLHVAELAEGENPLGRSAAFAEFQRGINDRCVEGPTPGDATVIGSYLGASGRSMPTDTDGSS